MAEEAGTNAGTSMSGENLVSLGALLVIGSWLVFEVIAEEYFVTTVAVAVALLIVVLPRLDVDAITSVTPVLRFLKLAGYLLALIGVVEIIDELRSGLLDAGGAAIVGALVAYAGYVAAFMGARSIKS